MKKYPSYLNLSREQFSHRIQQAREMLKSCCICPHHCKINRIEGEKGICRSTDQLMVSSYNVHFGEEPPISGTNGSGTIFFTYCTLNCVFCQNYPISQLGNGNILSISKLSRIMLDLQKKKCHNINLVTPTHFVPQIIEATEMAVREGLCIPIVYNTSGYESVETLKLLEGIVDIYLPDAKYADDRMAKKYSNANHYFSVMERAIKEMYRQVGHLRLNQQGIAITGLMIRHLVLPHQIAGTHEILKWISGNIAPETYISLMAQFFPAYLSSDYPELSRRINRQEYRQALNSLNRFDLSNGWIQECE